MQGVYVYRNGFRVLPYGRKDWIGFTEKSQTAANNIYKEHTVVGYLKLDGFTSEKLEEGKYRVCIIVENVVDNVEKKDGDGGKFCDCTQEKESNKVVVIRSSVMGEGDPELGKVLLKGFIYAISQQKDLPKTMLFYNGGAFITCEGSQSLEDLKALEEQGVKILTCGTCLNHYGLTAVSYTHLDPESEVCWCEKIWKRQAIQKNRYKSCIPRSVWQSEHRLRQRSHFL